MTQINPQICGKCYEVVEPLAVKSLHNRKKEGLPVENDGSLPGKLGFGWRVALRCPLCHDMKEDICNSCGSLHANVPPRLMLLPDGKQEWLYICNLCYEAEDYGPLMVPNT